MYGRSCPYGIFFTPNMPVVDAESVPVFFTLMT